VTSTIRVKIKKRDRRREKRKEEKLHIGFSILIEKKNISIIQDTFNLKRA